MNPSLRRGFRTLAPLWDLPNTALGLGMAGLALATGGRATRVHGALEVHGGGFGALLARLPIGPRAGTAVTIGRVVLATCPATLETTRAHERVHVAQYRRWGPLFLPAYAAASAWARLRGRDPYRDNRFEREAFAKAPLGAPSAARGLERFTSRGLQTG